MKTNIKTKIKKELQKRRNINLCDKLAKKAKKISLSKDNVSEGIRTALEEYEL